MKKLSLDVLQEKARLIIREKLRNYAIPDEITSENLLLESDFESDEGVFYLYYLKDENSSPDCLIAKARLNRFSGEGKVNIFLSKKETSK